ncbi:MAG: outer membrane beta-barrel protein [Flammeovirgaceae bacterium]
MKFIKHIFTLFMVTFFCSGAFAQINIGAQASYFSMGSESITSPGLGIRGEYGITEKAAFTASINYYFGTEENLSFTARSSTDQIEVPVTHNLSFLHASIGAKYYIAGNYESNVGFYGLFGLGLMLAPSKLSYGDFDRSTYTLDEELGNETLQNFTINLGIGLEKNFESFAVFGEGRVALPANEQNGQAIAFEIPTSTTLQLGVRIPISQ